MKKNLILVLFLVFTQSLSIAQPFGGNGATWHYSVYSIFPPYNNSPVQITSSGPFIFNGLSCYRLSINPTTCATDTAYTVYEKNDSVYYYLPISNHFVMLYNYNAMVGDTQTIYGEDAFGADTSIQLLVTSTGTININGFTKKTYTTSLLGLPSYFEFGGQIIEDIGSTSFLFPQYSFCDPLVGGLRCYEDSIIGLYNFQPPLSCDTTIWLGVNEPDADRNISISPNPFTSEISITIQKQNVKQATFSIKNILGQTVFNKQENNFSNSYTKTFDLSFLSKGIYFLDVNIDGEQAVKKIVKE